MDEKHHKPSIQGMIQMQELEEEYERPTGVQNMKNQEGIIV